MLDEDKASLLHWHQIVLFLGYFLYANKIEIPPFAFSVAISLREEKLTK